MSAGQKQWRGPAFSVVKQLGGMDEDFTMQPLDSTLQSPSETLLSIRLLDFKTSLLEAIEELRIRRETENNYEEQISKIVVEKQELEWQKETLQHQTDTLHQQNKEAIAAFKKQLQARMFAMEEEKGKYQLAVETKEKEIDGLKEALKALQISKCTLQKKLNEMGQKLQMHLTAKEEHQKKLNEIERCYATIASQFGVVKGIHGKLEHSVQEAIQLNKKLTSVNKRQETEISNLKEELKKVTTDLIRSKVTSQYRVGEENINLAAKEKQFQELQQKIRMESAVTKKVQEDNTHIKEEKLTLERDNELQREKAKENEEKFLNLQNEHEEALRTWKKDEENMRREIETLKNELNSFKGVHRHLEDHPPQGNQDSEQVQNLQSGEEHSKTSDVQAVQEESTCMETTIRKDSNSGHEETEVQNAIPLSIAELQIEQSNNTAWITEISGIEERQSTDLQVLENSFKDEINVASPYEEKQREASPRNTLCTDTDLITQGQTSEIPVTECKEAENLGATCRMLLGENSANSEQKLQDSHKPLAVCHTQTRKVLLDRTDTVGTCRKNGSEETDYNKPELCSVTDESVCNKAEKKSNTIQHNKSVLIPEAPQTECEAVVCSENNAVCKRSTDNHQAKEASFGILSCNKENSQTEYQRCSLLDNDNYVGNGLHKPEQSLLNLSGLHGDKLPFKQTHIDAENRICTENATNANRDGALESTGVPLTDPQDPPTAYCDKASSDDATKTHSDKVSAWGTFSLYPPTTESGINMDDLHSKQPEQDGAEQAGNATNAYTSNAEAAVEADALEIIAHKPLPADRISTDKLIPCKKVNDDIQICSIKTRHSLESNNLTNNTLLTEKKDSLNSTVPGRKFAEGHLEESSALPTRTSGNSVNMNGRSSFDLSASDKKAEKTPVYFNFLDLSSCSRVNQMRGQATWTPASKEPPLLKLPCLLEHANVTSITQKLSENVDRRETGLASTSLNRAADTLNISSIHREPQGDPSEGWNATAKTFYDSSFPTEHKSPHVTVTPASCGSAAGEEDRSSIHNSIVQNQREEIEKILNVERLHSARKRKYEEGQ
ncbi:coiled-coil domain-containing protein 73 isoform X1 [Melanerpes formicivorus]|uniref:coiled-coil domain-containing protein 73 isoform X1 n=1 Tax=Melanerpes formicivorus TaxID=211600 RepID=UPI00358E4324